MEVTRVLVIGLDSADRHLIDRWIGEGLLPTLQRLREKGVWGSMTPPPGLGNNAAWPSFFTGASPTKHGRYTYCMIAPRSYHTAKFGPDDYRCEPFWNSLCRAGRRVAILDVPKAPLAKDLNGVQIADWALHDPIYPRPCSWPTPWSVEVVERLGNDPVEMCDGHDGGVEQLLRLREALLVRIQRKTQFVCEVLERQEWDFATAVFADSHCAGHHFWHLHDASHRAHDPQARGKTGDLLQEIYVALDSALARVLESAGGQTRVIVFSALGMGPNNSGHDLLDEALRRFEKTPAVGEGRRLYRTLGVIKHWMPLRLRRRLGPLVQDQLANILLSRDRRSRRCFAEPHNDVLAGIRINVKGREPYGQVAPGADYESYCQHLGEQLGSLINLDSHRPAVKSVTHSRELYPQAPPGELPDLFVEWNKDTPIDRLGGPSIEPVSRSSRRHRTGDHTPDGFYIAAGPGLALRRAAAPATVLDIAPTVAAWLNVPLSEFETSPLPLLD
jgi:predicted AlkP superfamily phosphohydrolase/phosphomutase